MTLVFFGHAAARSSDYTQQQVAAIVAHCEINGGNKCYEAGSADYSRDEAQALVDHYTALAEGAIGKTNLSKDEIAATVSMTTVYKFPEETQLSPDGVLLPRNPIFATLDGGPAHCEAMRGQYAGKFGGRGQAMVLYITTVREYSKSRGCTIGLYYAYGIKPSLPYDLKKNGTGYHGMRARVDDDTHRGKLPTKDFDLGKAKITFLDDGTIKLEWKGGGNKAEAIMMRVVQ